ncbi:MAG: hypothetical protein ACKKL6_01925 [Candidatus Komeilibacteria bacterium]
MKYTKENKMITDKRYFHVLILPLIYVVFGGIPGYLGNITFSPFFALSAFVLAPKFYNVPSGKILLALLGIGIFLGGMLRWFVDPESVYTNVENISWSFKFAFAFLPSIAFYSSAIMAWYIHDLQNKKTTSQ